MHFSKDADRLEILTPSSERQKEAEKAEVKKKSKTTENDVWKVGMIATMTQQRAVFPHSNTPLQTPPRSMDTTDGWDRGQFGINQSP